MSSDPRLKGIPKEKMEQISLQIAKIFIEGVQATQVDLK
jgi:hypothetical protein